MGTVFVVYRAIQRKTLQETLGTNQGNVCLLPVDRYLTDDIHEIGAVRLEEDTIRNF